MKTPIHCVCPLCIHTIKHHLLESPLETVRDGFFTSLFYGQSFRPHTFTDPIANVFMEDPVLQNTQTQFHAQHHILHTKYTGNSSTHMHANSFTHTLHSKDSSQTLSCNTLHSKHSPQTLSCNTLYSKHSPQTLSCNTLHSKHSPQTLSCNTLYSKHSSQTLSCNTLHSKHSSQTLSGNTLHSKHSSQTMSCNTLHIHCLPKPIFSWKTPICKFCTKIVLTLLHEKCI